MNILWNIIQDTFHWKKTCLHSSYDKVFIAIPKSLGPNGSVPSQPHNLLLPPLGWDAEEVQLSSHIMIPIPTWVPNTSFLMQIYLFIVTEVWLQNISKEEATWNFSLSSLGMPIAWESGIPSLLPFLTSASCCGGDKDHYPSFALSTPACCLLPHFSVYLWTFVTAAAS